MDTPTSVIDTLSLHDALPISRRTSRSSTSPCCSSTWRASSTSRPWPTTPCSRGCWSSRGRSATTSSRSEEHTSELQSLRHLVCRLLLEKKKNTLAYG